MQGMLYGPTVIEFEEAFAKYIGGTYPIAFNSATNAIEALFTILRIEETTIPAMIPPVVANALYHAGTTVRLGDNVDWVGGLYTLYEDADHIIIDSAQEVAPEQFKKYKHPFKDTTMIFSFYPTKPVGSCDGGMIVTNNGELGARLRLFSNNGAHMGAGSWNNKFVFPGQKSYMNSIQATIAHNNLKQLDKKRKALDYIREYYHSKLGLPSVHSGYHLYRIEVEDNKRFLLNLKTEGITCGIHYTPISDMQAYDWTLRDKLPLTNAAKDRMVSIPFHENLTMRELEHVIAMTKKYR